MTEYITNKFRRDITLLTAIIIASSLFLGCGKSKKAGINSISLQINEIIDTSSILESTVNLNETIETVTLQEGQIPVIYRNHIYITSEINKVSGNFVFDTGADGLYLDSTFFANAAFGQFKFTQAFLPGAGSEGPQKVKVINDFITLKFNNINKNTSFAPIFLLKPVLGDFADGIIGKEFFIKQILEINYFQEFLRLYNEIEMVDLSGYVKISMKNERNRLFVPAVIQINDAISIQDYLLLDLGSGGSISITSKTADKYKLSVNISEKVPYYTKYGGISGQSSSCYFCTKSVELGGYKLNDVVMDYSEDKSGALSNKDHAGLLGNGILEHFDVIIDFINNDLYLKPNKNYNKPFSFSKRGFGFVDRSITKNSWIVTGLYKESNAEKAGLKIDDKIISINGINIKDIPYKKQSEFWQKTDKVTLIVLRNEEEKKIEFDLKTVL